MEIGIGDVVLEGCHEGHCNRCQFAVEAAVGLGDGFGVGADARADGQLIVEVVLGLQATAPQAAAAFCRRNAVAQARSGAQLRQDGYFNQHAQHQPPKIPP